MDHLEIWKAMKLAEEKEYRKSREENERKEKKVTQEIRELLAKHGVTELSTNGYSYNFEFSGKAYHFVNQDTRICCHIHRPFISDEDEECFHDMESAMLHDEAELFIEEYEYKHFIINHKPVRALRQLLAN